MLVNTITIFLNLLMLNPILSMAEVAPSVMEDMKQKEYVDYLIQLPPHPEVKKDTQLNELEIHELEAHCNQSQADILKQLEYYKTTGDVEYYKSYYMTNTIAVNSKKKVVDELSKRDDVEEISSNRKFQLKPNSLDNFQVQVLNEVNWTGASEHWSIAYINATGTSDLVKRNAGYLRYANADTGVEFDHPAIKDNYLGLKPDGTVDHNYFWWDANKKENSTHPNTKCGINSQVPCGDDDHGTHTMSTVVGKLGLGVSPTTKWMACKNMDNNFGSPESYLGCLQFFLAPTRLDGSNPRPDLRPHVIGNSYTCPPSEGCSATTFQYALRILKMSGILMSVSAGNSGAEGCGSIQYPPAVDPNSFTVGALNYQRDTRAYFSSLGPVPQRTGLSGLDVMAPGVNITGAALGGTYKSLAGTSMASPHVSGAALLIMAACPHLYRQVDAIENLIRETAMPIYSNLGCGDDTNGTYPNNEFGYGKINVGRAIEKCKGNRLQH